MYIRVHTVKMLSPVENRDSNLVKKKNLYNICCLTAHTVAPISIASVIYYEITNMLNGTANFARISKLCVKT